MNKYIVPICDIQAGKVWNKTLSASSLNACREKLMEQICNDYDMDLPDSYHEFVKTLDNNDILIGNIRDIEEL